MRFSFEDDSEKITLQKVSGCDGLTLGITIPRPGTLGQFLAGYDRRVITKLRVIDSIDAEDIATLNALPNLSVLDMENADLTRLPSKAFKDNKTLTSIKLPKTLTTIGEKAFSHCTGLTGNLTIPNSVTKIRQGAFWDCTGLTSVTIPSGVTNIQMHAFSACAGLTTIYCKANTPPQLYLGRHSEAFKGVSTSKCVLYVPTGCAHAYRTAEGWRNYDFKIIETKF